MKIDLVVTELNVGGAERCLANLAMFLSKRGHQTRVIALGCEPPPHRAELACQLKNQNIPVEFLGGNSIKKWFSVRRKLVGFVRRQPPDISQSFLFHANVLAASVYPGFGIPLIGGVRVAEPRRWRHWTGKWAARRMKQVVCVSDATAYWCHRFEKVPMEKIVVIPNGIEMSSTDVETFQEGRRERSTDQIKSLQELQINPDAALLLFVGRLDLQKGIDQLVRHAPFLMNRLPKHHLLIIGEGALGEQLRSEVEQLGLSNRVHFLGWKSNPRSWMRISELLLLPARYEGMPNVILEAMAEQIPVVATAAEGISTLLGNEAGHQSVPVGAYDKFIERTIYLIENTNERQRLAEANFRRCTAYFRLEDQLAKYEHLYLDLLNPNRS